MKDLLKIALVSFIVFGVMKGIPIAVAGLQAVPSVWDSDWEDDPDNTDSIGQGDDWMRNIKQEIRGRLETEHHFGSFGSSDDSGRHWEGSARIYFQDAAPTTGPPVADYDNGSAGATADQTIDEGRMWADGNNGNTLYVADPNNADGHGGGNYEEAIALPTNAIILWDQATGDENCDGVTTAGNCPCGFTRASEFDGIGVRGYDPNNATTNVADPNQVPDAPGISCDNDTAGAGCSAVALERGDSITVPITGWGADPNATDPDAGTTAGTLVTAAGKNPVEEALDPIAVATTAQTFVRTGPFRTVVFCRKS